MLTVPPILNEVKRNIRIDALESLSSLPTYVRSSVRDYEVHCEQCVELLEHVMKIGNRHEFYQRTFYFNFQDEEEKVILIDDNMKATDVALAIEWCGTAAMKAIDDLRTITDFDDRLIRESLARQPT